MVEENTGGAGKQAPPDGDSVDTRGGEQKQNRRPRKMVRRKGDKQRRGSDIAIKSADRSVLEGNEQVLRREKWPDIDGNGLKIQRRGWLG